MAGTGLFRLELDGTVEHKNGQQFIDGKGMAGDSFKRVHRIEPHGFASSPVKGGIAAAFAARGNPDSAYAFGGENPSMRPELESGGSAIYDHNGNIASIVTSGIRIVHTGTVTIEAPEIILTGDVQIDGNLAVTGNVTSEGTITDSDGNNGA